MITEIDPDDGELKVRVDDQAGTIILNRPKKRNALSNRLIQSLQQAFFDLQQEKRVRAIILTGSQPCFCAGTDLAEVQEISKEEDAVQSWFNHVNAVRDLMETMLLCPKPIVAAINGPALGTGLGLALASDIVVGCEQSRFGLPEPRRGLVAGLVIPLLAFRIGGGATANMLLRGQTIDNSQAKDMGLVHELATEDLLWVKANEITKEIGQSPAAAISMSKRTLYEGAGQHLSTLLTNGAAAMATARTTEVAEEGVDSFLGKRQPEWPE